MNELILILMVLLGTSMVVDSTEAEAGGFDQSDVASLPVDRSGNLGGRVYDDAGNCHIAGTRYKTPCKTKLNFIFLVYNGCLIPVFYMLDCNSIFALINIFNSNTPAVLSYFGLNFNTFKILINFINGNVC
jgi:hypothetical protein